MERQGIIKTLILLFAVGIFIFQMQNSIRKYLARPVVQMKSSVPVQDITLPVVYICQDDQFNYSTENPSGYTSMTRLLLGSVGWPPQDAQITWKGLHKNITFKKLQTELFIYNYTDLTSADSKFESVFLTPHGFCMKMDKTITKKFSISDTKKSLFLMTDPARVSELRTDEVHETRVSFGPTFEDYFDSASYIIEYTLYDETINDGINCVDYSRLNSSYGDCIWENMKSKLLEFYGCLPPWFPRGTGLICEEDLEIKVNDAMSKNVASDINEMIRGRELDMFQSCLSPCTKTDIRMTTTSYKAKMVGSGRVNFVTKESVNVYTEVYAYDEFSLVVDLGSALGLWLGLSALTIVDYLINALNFVNKKFH